MLNGSEKLEEMKKRCELIIKHNKNITGAKELGLISYFEGQSRAANFILYGDWDYADKN
jgi:hypothetical protein